MQEGKFDETSQIWFTEVEKKPPDPTRLQSAMFMDRPDLWKKAKKNGRKRTPPNQSKMFDDPDHLYLGLAPQCKIDPQTPASDCEETPSWGE